MLDPDLTESTPFVRVRCGRSHPRSLHTGLSIDELPYRSKDEYGRFRKGSIRVDERPPDDLAPSGFEPLSPAPKASMLGHYTTGLQFCGAEGDTNNSGRCRSRPQYGSPALQDHIGSAATARSHIGPITARVPSADPRARLTPKRSAPLGGASRD